MCWVAILGVASAALGAASSIQQSRAAQVSEGINKQIALRNAAAVDEEEANVHEAAAIERRRLGEKVRAEKGGVVANAAAMGLLPNGTVGDVVGDLQRAYDIDRSILGKNENTTIKGLDKEKADYLAGALQAGNAAKSAATAGSLSAAGGFLDSASGIASHWITPNTSRTRVTTGAGRTGGLVDYGVLAVNPGG